MDRQLINSALGTPQTVHRIPMPTTQLPVESKENNVSIYHGKLDGAVVVRQMAVLQKIYKVDDEFIDILTDRIKANNFSNERLIDAVNNLIDTNPYKTFNIADIISFDKKIKTYTYDQICNMAQGSKNIFQLYKRIYVNGKDIGTYASVQDIEIYRLKVVEKKEKK